MSTCIIPSESLVQLVRSRHLSLRFRNNTGFNTSSKQKVGIYLSQKSIFCCLSSTSIFRNSLLASPEFPPNMMYMLYTYLIKQEYKYEISDLFTTPSLINKKCVPIIPVPIPPFLLGIEIQKNTITIVDVNIKISDTLYQQLKINLENYLIKFAGNDASYLLLYLFIMAKS